jgi:cytochrome c oxidase cbb3-type subunit III
MSDHENTPNEEINHSYDGIVEHNNPMPAWWSWIFILTVCFAFLYYIHYEISGTGLTLKQELEISMKKINEIRMEYASKFTELTDDELLRKMKDPNSLQLGAATYQAKCAMCHGEKLEGKIGPNLTDNTWINGGTPQEILKTIRTGVTAKGMPQWEGVLKPDEIYGVLGFIQSKKQNP